MVGVLIFDKFKRLVYSGCVIKIGDLNELIIKGATVMKREAKLG